MAEEKTVNIVLDTKVAVDRVRYDVGDELTVSGAVAEHLVNLGKAREITRAPRRKRKKAATS